MSTKKQSKKLNKFKTSPLIAVIAVIEVIILVCACTFAWFVFTKNTTISTEFLTVEPDSGLEIDFNTADENDFVVINQYILDNFKFEPVTSTDGRNIFVPTTGSFDKSNTENMAFREATVNDMNQKYICIDFTLTNTGQEAMPVYLSPKSSFTVAGKEGKALRLAFYQNDGSSGDIDATYYQTGNADDNVVTVFFKNTNKWEHPYAYAYSDADGDNNKSHNMTWPGVPITHISGNLYYYTFSTKYTVGGEAFNNELNRIIFSNGKETNKQTDNRGIHNNYIYTASTETNDKGHFLLDREIYTSSIVDGTYPIVSPGVSVGFQRQYAPVTNIDNSTGAATAIVPAYANSIDNYSFSESNPPLFTIGSFKTISLSMIVWLEGTDPACTSDHYSGRDIDINLIFATKESKDVEYSTYTFYDKTKETWIAHETPSSTGANVKPVMQLYDLDKDKGYLMYECDWVEEDGSQGRAKTWTVDAPEEIMAENHKVVFRRVNPLDENEIWNYWDASGLSKSSADMINGQTDTGTSAEGIINDYYFTAFADGTPESFKTGSTTTPEFSCGGLWGQYDVTQLKLYDGTRDNYFGSNGGVVTINYNYNGQLVEYKASGPDYGFYTFVVPNVIFNKNNASASSTMPEVNFKRFYGFDANYAINSDRQDKDKTKYDNSWSAGTIRGRFFEINQSPTYINDGKFITYWGDEVIYIQNEGDFGEMMDKGLWKVHFSNSSKNHYTYLYKHYWTKLKGDNGEEYEAYYYSDKATAYSYGYPCVVPSDAKYTDLRVVQTSADSSESIWNYTPKISLTSDSTDYAKYSNYIKRVNTATNKEDIINILKLTHLQHTVFFQIDAVGASPEDGTNAPNIYVYEDGGNGDNNGWPGVDMEYVSTNSAGTLHKYKADVNVTKYDKMQFTIELCDDSAYLKIDNGWWTNDEAWFAGYFWKSSNKNDYKWVKAEYLTSGLYRVVIPSGYDMMLWGRMNPYYTNFSWDSGHVWNQTVDLSVPTSDSRVYYLTSDNTGSWGTYTGGDNGTDLLKSNILDIGTSGNKSGEIYQGEVTGGGIDVEKLNITEDGVDTAESVMFDCYSTKDWH